MQALDVASGPAQMPDNGVWVELTVTAPNAGLSAAPEGPFQRRLALLLTGARSRVAFYFKGTRAQAAPVEVSATATNLDTGVKLAMDTLRISLQPGPPSDFEVKLLSTDEVLVGVARRFQIRPVDAYGNVVVGWNGQVLLSAVVGADAPGPVLTAPGPTGWRDGVGERDVIFSRVDCCTALLVSDAANPRLAGRSALFAVRAAVSLP